MKALIAAVILGTGLALPATAATWAYPPLRYDVQGSKGAEGGYDRRQPPREYRPERRAERWEQRERFKEDERRALQRDLDKANRELYKRRHK